MPGINNVAFVVHFNVPTILFFVSLLLGGIAAILLYKSKYDKNVFAIKNFNVTIGILVAPATILLFSIIGIIIWLCGAKGQLGQTEIYWYAIMIVLGMIAALVFAFVMAKKKGVKSEIILEMAICAIVLGVIGARLWYVIFDISGESWSFAEMLRIWDGGLGIYGGVIGGAIGVVIVAMLRKVGVLTLLDIAAPCVLIAQAFGRWGNFFNQEAFGVEITNKGLQWFPFAVCIGNSYETGTWHAATFFYESLWNIIGFIGLYIFMYKFDDRIKGLGVAGYFLWYGIGRSLIEPLRTDSLLVPGTGIRVSVLFSIIMICASIAFATYQIVMYIKKKKNQETPLEKTEDN